MIRAIAAGKVAAANIDNYLGYNHIISVDVDIPTARLDDRPACGRVNMTERAAADRKEDFDLSLIHIYRHCTSVRRSSAPLPSGIPVLR